MPTFNRAKYITGSINSLRRQTYSNFELIISDNASTDRTSLICKEIMKKDKRIRYIRQKKNIGAVHNFNFVLNKAHGDYFMWASDDDYWEKNYIEELIDILIKNKNYVVAICDYSYFNNHREISKKLNLIRITDTTKRIIYFLENFQNLLAPLYYGIFRKKILLDIGGVHVDSRPYYKAGDIVTMFKVLLNGNFAYKNKILFKKRDTSGFLLDEHETIRKMIFTQEVIFRIKRYLCSPLIFLYDVFYFLKFTFQSNLRYRAKLQISFSCLKWLIVASIQFISIMSRGISYIFTDTKTVLWRKRFNS